MDPRVNLRLENVYPPSRKVKTETLCVGGYGLEKRCRGYRKDVEVAWTLLLQVEKKSFLHVKLQEGLWLRVMNEGLGGYCPFDMGGCNGIFRPSFCHLRKIIECLAQCHSP